MPTDQPQVVYKPVCETCKQGPEHGVGIYRTGEKGPGKNPHWRCSAHLPSNHEVDPEVAEVTAIIESDSATKH